MTASCHCASFFNTPRGAVMASLCAFFEGIFGTSRLPDFWGGLKLRAEDRCHALPTAIEDATGTFLLFY